MGASVLATATIDGPEARGRAALLQQEDGRTILRLTDYWIAPGAPDVHLYLSPSPEANVGAEGSIDFGRMTQLEGNLDLVVPPVAEAHRMKTVVVVCKAYMVEFGRGTFDGRDLAVVRGHRD